MPAVLSQGPDHKGKDVKGWVPDEKYNVITVTVMTGSALNFDILSSAMKTQYGKVIVMTPKTPVSGTFYFANNTAVIPLGQFGDRKANKTHEKPPVGDYSNATINVAGASAVMAMKNITMTGMGDKASNKTSKGHGCWGEMQFTDVGVYLPNGTANSYTLGAPVKVTKSADNKSMMIVGNPMLGTILQGSLASGNKFPASAQPVMLKTVDGVK